VIHVRQDAEAKFRVLVENVALGHMVVQVCTDEGFILQDITQQCAHLLPATGARVGFENPMTRSGKLLKSLSHAYTSLSYTGEKSSIALVSSYHTPGRKTPARAGFHSSLSSRQRGQDKKCLTYGPWGIPYGEPCLWTATSHNDSLDCRATTETCS